MKPVSVKVSASGRLHLPSEVRKALGLKGAGHVVITVEDGQATLMTMAANLARIRALARPYAPQGRLASEELIAERRGGARGEGGPPRAAGGWAGARPSGGRRRGERRPRRGPRAVGRGRAGGSAVERCGARKLRGARRDFGGARCRACRAVAAGREGVGGERRRGHRQAA